MKQLITTLIITLLLSTKLFAQSYKLTVSNETYQPLDKKGPVNLIVGGGGEAWSGFGADAPLGFQFIFFKPGFDTLILSDMGMGGGGKKYSWNFEVLYGANVRFIDRNYKLGQGNQGSAQSSVWYRTEGETGKRIFQIEYYNVKANTSTKNDSMNFQLWLYEGSNVLEFRYGSGAIETPDSIFFPIKQYKAFQAGLEFGFADSNGTVHNTDRYYLKGNPDNPELVYINDERDNYTFLNRLPSTGTVYRFTPQAVGIPAYGKNLQLLAYPNPANETLYIKGSMQEETLAVIYDMAGRLLLEQSITAEERKISLQGIPAGMYLLKLSNSKGMQVQKIVKQ